MRKFNTKSWTVEENSLLLEYYHTLSYEALSYILVDRSKREVAVQAVYLERKNHKFNK